MSECAKGLSFPILNMPFIHQKDNNDNQLADVAGWTELVVSTSLDSLL